MNTFDEVEKRYNQTRPIISIHHTLHDDIRPIGQRRRKWERIIRVSKNHYALSDGSSWIHHSATSEYDSVAKTLTKIAIAQSPVQWRKFADNSEMIIIRNSSYGGATGTYNFIYEHMPRGLGFSIKGGRQYVHTATEKYYLPHSEAKVDHKQIREILNSKDASGFRVPQETRVLKFIRPSPHSDWSLFGKEFNDKKKKKIINKAAKANLKPFIRSLREYTEHISPMFPRGMANNSPYNLRTNSSNEYRVYREQKSASQEAIKELSESTQRIHWWRDGFLALHHEFLIKEIKKPESEMMYHIAFLLWDDSEGYRVENEAGLKSWRSRFNLTANKALNLYKTIGV